MQTKLNKSKKIILDTRHENKANKTGFTLLSHPSKKSYIKIFSDSAYENTLTPQQIAGKHMIKLHHWKVHFTRILTKFGLEFLEQYTNK